MTLETAKQLKELGWEHIPNYPDYMISKTGEIRSLDKIVNFSGGKRLRKGRVLKQWITVAGYKRVSLYNCDGQKFLVVHRLVAQTFMPNPENKSCVNHKDCNKQNNRIENLEWVTNMENSNHAKVNNRLPCGENHKSSKFTLEQIMKIRENPERLSRRKLSIIFKTSHSHIRRIQENQVWNSIKLRKEGIV